VDMSDFGANFKKARESKGISLDRVAAETRISTRFLLAIENEEFHLLPGGIFNRGFVRAYAERVGLDPDQAIANYERLTEVRTPVEAATPAPTPRRNKHLYTIVIGGVVLLIVIFYLVTRDPANSAQVPGPSAGATAEVTPSPTATANFPTTGNEPAPA